MLITVGKEASWLSFNLLKLPDVFLLAIFFVFLDGRRVQNWYRTQSSRELTYDYDSDYMESDEFQTAVAAAAFAIASAEERRRSRRKRDGSTLSKQPKIRRQEDGHEVSVTRKIKERMPSSSSSSASNYKMKNKMKEDHDTVPISTPSLLSRKFSGTIRTYNNLHFHHKF